MASLVETAYHTAEVLNITYTSGEARPQIPRTSLPIASGIITLFTHDINHQEAIQHIHDVAPVLIALNEAVDIGVSAELRIKQQTTQSGYHPLLHLKNLTHRNLQTRLMTFYDSFPLHAKRPDLQPYISDLFWLSAHRHEFTYPEWQQYLEIDSSIFEAISLAVSIPSALEAAQYNPNQPVDTKNDLLNKYRIFHTSHYHQSAPKTPQEKAIRALHGLAMALKVYDDEVGDQIDLLLDLPNYHQFAYQISHTSKEAKTILSTLKKHYTNIAVENGLPQTVVRTATILCRATSVAKEHNAKDDSGKPLSLDDLDDLFIGTQQTTLRHKLDGNGSPLVELFAQRPLGI
jgi:hypothetical protein